MFLINDSYIEVKKSAKKGRGVFARSNIKAGTLIGDYLGKIIRDKEAELLEKKFGLYALYYINNNSIFPNLKQRGVHLINHSCMPNCNLIPYKGHFIFFATRHIFVGEELTISYDMQPPSNSKETNYPCFCDSLLCNGTMFISKKKRQAIETFSEKELKKYSKFYKSEQILEKLPTYPKNIPDYDFINLYANLAKRPLIINKNLFPKLSEIRLTIRKSGRSIYLNRFGVKIIAVSKKIIISGLTN